MAMRINKSRSSIIVLLTFLLTGIFCPAVLPAFQEPPPGPQTDEEREQLLDMIRQRMEQRQQDQENPQFQRFPPMRQQMQQQLIHEQPDPR